MTSASEVMRRSILHAKLPSFNLLASKLLRLSIFITFFRNIDEPFQKHLNYVFQIHLNYSKYIWTIPKTFELFQIHLNYSKYIWTIPNTFELFQIHLNYFKYIWTISNTVELFQIHLNIQNIMYWNCSKSLISFVLYTCAFRLETFSVLFMKCFGVFVSVIVSQLRFKGIFLDKKKYSFYNLHSVTKDFL